MSASPFTHARRAPDGLLVSLLNAALQPGIEQQPYVHHAPRGELQPGHCWQWSADIDDWRQIPDRRGDEYQHPTTHERMAITHPLQQPPVGWVLVVDDGVRIGL